VTLDVEALEQWCTDNGKPFTSVTELRDDADLHARISEAIDEANKAVSRAESIRTFRILAGDFTEENGYLTPSLKLKRSVVMKDFAKDVEQLYAGPKP
jgi:long-chain acyl-CoA synthetase